MDTNTLSSAMLAVIVVAMEFYLLDRWTRK
jgi:hypothetical protein